MLRQHLDLDFGLGLHVEEPSRVRIVAAARGDDDEAIAVLALDEGRAPQLPAPVASRRE